MDPSQQFFAHGFRVYPAREPIRARGVRENRHTTRVDWRHERGTGRARQAASRLDGGQPSLPARAGFPYVTMRGRVFVPAALDHPFSGLRHAPWRERACPLRGSALDGPPSVAARVGRLCLPTTLATARSRCSRLKRGGREPLRDSDAPGLRPPPSRRRWGAGRFGALRLLTAPSGDRRLPPHSAVRPWGRSAFVSCGATFALLSAPCPVLVDARRPQSGHRHRRGGTLWTP